MLPVSTHGDVSHRGAKTYRLLSIGAILSLLMFLPVRPVEAAGCSDLAQAPHSRWTTEARHGVQWLVTPCGQPFFSLGVNAVDGGAEVREKNGRIFYNWPSLAPDLKSWAEAARLRLLQWGFNTAGAWSLSPGLLRMPEVVELALGRSSQFHWVDPFDPANLERMRQIARAGVAPFKGDPYRIGYFTDNEVGWWNGPLFTVFSAYPAENHTKQRLVRLLRDRYGNNWQGFVRDFVPPADVQSFSGLLQSQATTHLRPGGQGIEVVRQWTAIVAEQYYRTVTQAVREADPEALILGDRLPIYYDPDAVHAMARYVDVISVNYNLDAPNGWVAPYFFAALGQLSRNKPVLVSEWFFAAHENRSGNLNRTGYPNVASAVVQSSNINLTGHLMTVQTQNERARGAAAGAKRLAALPNVVGLHWFQYYDHPQGGRDDGEDYNFGLVDIYDRPYEALTEAFQGLHPTLARLHESAGRSPAAARAGMLPHAEVLVGDNSLTDWPLDSALMPLRTKSAEAAFGDLYVSWSGNGLNLATISMDYYDPELLSYQDDFPLSEVFRIDLGLDAGSGSKRFAMLVIPDRPTEAKVQKTFRTVLCRVGVDGCQPVAGAQTSYFGVAMDQPRVILEAMLPWSALGLQEAPRGQLRLAAAVTGFYRSRWMSSTGVEPERLFARASNWPIVQLQNRR